MEAANNPEDNESALQKVKQAVHLGGQYAELPRAIELMEQAFALDEGLRNKYGPILDKWKSGVIL